MNLHHCEDSFPVCHNCQLFCSERNQFRQIKWYLICHFAVGEHAALHREVFMVACQCVSSCFSLRIFLTGHVPSRDMHIY